MRSTRILLGLILCMVFIATLGCIQQQGPSQTETPTPTATPEQDVFYAKYAFDRNVALFHRVRIEATVDDNAYPTQIFETVTLPLEITPDYTKIEMVMIKAIKLDKNGVSDLCKELGYSKKQSVVNLFRDGRVDYGTYSVTNFYMPQRALRIGDTWKFEGIDYKLEEATTVKTLAGEFPALRISFSGKRASKYGYKDINGVLFFDYVNDRIAKYVQTEKVGNYVRKIESELIDVKYNYTEPPMDCVFSSSALSAEEKYERARYWNTFEKFRDSLYFALSAKQDLQEKDLNAEQKQLYKNILEVIIDDYRMLNEKENEARVRFEAANFYLALFEEQLANKLADARDYFAARYHLQALTGSDTQYNKQAKEKLAELDAKQLGIARGKALLKDTGDNTGAIAELFDFEKIVRFGLLGEPYYNIPIIDENAQQELALYLYKDGYMPKFLIKAASDLLAKDNDFILEPLSSEDVNKAIVAGTCYNGKGFAQSKLVFENDSASVSADCNKYYVTILEQADYNIFVLKGEQKVLLDSVSASSSGVIIKHLALSENN